MIGYCGICARGPMPVMPFRETRPDGDRYSLCRDCTDLIAARIHRGWPVGVTLDAPG